MTALGFTTGAVAFGGTASTNLLYLGVHNPMDPSDAAGHPVATATAYSVTVDGTGQHVVTMVPWGGDSPWDTDTLYVRKAAHVVVAGRQSEKAQVDEYLPLAEQSAEWVLGQFAQHAALPDTQPGFVVFVESDSAVRNSWFSSAGSRIGWWSDAAGDDVAMSWITNPQGTLANLPGSRITVETGDGPAVALPLLAHEMTHATLDPQQDVNSTGAPAAYVVEGFAAWMEDSYAQQLTGRPSLLAAADAAVVHAAVAATSFSGKPPVDSDFYAGSSATAQRAYDLSATIWQWLSVTNGVDGAFGTVLHDYQGDAGLSNALATAWSQWARTTYG